jgi:CelD/BcsL family acetyltransferase involved in cellulose biosynthesis
MKLVVHGEIPENEGLRLQWNDLVRRMESPEVFYTYEWALAVSRAYKDSLRPLLLIAYEGDRVAGVVSLAIDVAEKSVSFLASTTADYGDFVCAPDNLQEFTGLVLTELRAIAANFVVASLPKSSATAHVLRQSAGATGSSYFLRPAFRCGQTTFSSPEQRCNVQRSIQSKRFDRQLKTLSREGTVAFRNLSEGPEIAAALPDFRKAHIERFGEQGRTSNLADPRRWHFVQELAQLLAAQGWMALSLLSVAGQPIAWNYGFRFAGSWFWYQPTFDGRFSAQSPGLCLLAWIIDEACAMPDMHRLDLGLGEESYKARFATDYRETVDVTVSSSTAHYFREKLRYRAASAIKSSPHLEQCVRWLLGKSVPTGARA